MNRTKLEAHISDLESKLAAAKDRLKASPEPVLTPAQKFAIYLHKNFCHINHADGCGFRYEEAWEHERCWDGDAHKHWFASAEKALEFLRSHARA